MNIDLPPLPYPTGALSPHISQRTLEFHYGKHQAGYVANLNRLIAGTGHADQTLEEIIRARAPHQLELRRHQPHPVVMTAPTGLHIDATSGGPVEDARVGHRAT